MRLFALRYVLSWLPAFYVLAGCCPPVRRTCPGSRQQTTAEAPGARVKTGDGKSAQKPQPSGAAARKEQPRRPDGRKPPERLTQAQAVADARHLVRLLEASHPDPYTPMGGKVAFKRRAAALLSSIPAPSLPTGVFAEKLQRFLARLSDGHTHLGSRGFQWAHPADALPVDFGVHATGLHVAGHDLPALDGTLGFLLAAVNGRSVTDLLKTLSLVTAVENRFQGYTKLRHVLTSPKLLSRLVPGYKASDPVRYTLVARNGKKVVRSVSAAGARKHKSGPVYLTGPVLWARAAQAAWRRPPRFFKGLPPSGDPFRYAFLRRGSVAYFRVKNIMGREAFELALKNNWGQPLKFIARYYKRRNRPVPPDTDRALSGIPSFVEKAEALLKEMKRRRSRTLIVDLQGNGGGATPMVFPFLYMLHGDRFYGHRFPVEFVTVQSALYLKKRRSTAAAWRKRTANPSFEVGNYLFSGDSPLGKGTARQKREKQIERYRIKKFSFAARLAALNGKPLYTPAQVVVLCDSATFSAAFHFMFFLRDLGAAVVGVPSGQAPNAFMEVTPFTLPVSRLPGSISNSAQIFMAEKPAARVLPVDHLLTYPVLRRYGFSPDAALRYALELVRTGRIRKPARGRRASHGKPLADNGQRRP